MAGTSDTILTLNVNYPRGKGGTRIARDTYEAFRRAILQAVPRRQSGIAFKDLPDAVAKRLRTADRQRVGSVGWYVTTVKLDLEARGLIERVPDAKPQRLRRVT